jgi:CubicO group peptidase (beta-lactamase class C family)
VLRARALLLCFAVVLLLAGAVAHAVSFTGAADIHTAGNLLLLATAITVAIAYAIPAVRGWLARPRRSGTDAVGDTVGRIVRRASPGVVAAMVEGDDVAFDCRGRAGSGVTLDETTVFEIGSVTKTFTALLLADMVQRNEVALDEPLATFLTPGSGRARITLLDLATHTAGLPRLPPDPRFLARAVLAHPDPYRGLTDADLERALRRARLRGAVGAQFRYSNFGFALLGLALARAARRPWADLVVERVCTPLGLDETRPVLAPELRARAASGHDRFGLAVPSWDLAAVAPAGALHSTGRDMARYIQALIDPAATPLAVALADVQQPRRRRNDQDQVGLGWLIRAGAAGTVTWHNGGTGGFGSFVGFDAAARRGVVLLTNAEHSKAVDRAGFALLGREAEEAALGQRL